MSTLPLPSVDPNDDTDERSDAPESADHLPVVHAPRRSLRRRHVANRAARYVVGAGGLGILASILAIFIVILLEALPLFFPPRIDDAVRLPQSEGAIRAHSVDGPSRWIASVRSDRTIRFLPLTGHAPSDGAGARALVTTYLASGGDAPPDVADTSAPTLSAAGWIGTRQQLLFGSSDGQILEAEIEWPPTIAAVAERDPESRPPEPASGKLSTVASGMRTPIIALTGAQAAGRTVILVAGDDAGSAQLTVLWISEKKGLDGSVRKKEVRADVALPAASRVFAVDSGARFAYVAVGNEIIAYDIREAGTFRELTRVQPTSAPITALAVLLGGEKLIVGDRDGHVSSWMPVGGRLTEAHRFDALSGPVVDIAVSSRNRGFVALDVNGIVHYNFGTSGSTQLKFDSGVRPASSVTLPAKGDFVIVGAPSGTVAAFPFDNPHPDASLTTLFGRVWYEGYPGPEYVWQSSSGSDEFEPKMSLIPLIFGSLKGTFYSLFFAVPLALLAALYVSEFMNGRLKALVKPLIELMAALPSVVVGFIAGLWLAPIVASEVLGILIAPIVLALTVVAGGFLWNRFATDRIRAKMRGYEALVMLPLIPVGIALAFALGSVIGHTLPGSSFPLWLHNVVGLDFDQRNSLVVGIAMGFAVIPLIFTISEDSLSSVPKHLRAASLALGANRWQTAIRVVLPAASPGIFSAIMLGFGRAVGETMIVLMATGNTPLMEVSPFTGFRALSANIAVELPEAARDSTLYRVLFLAALLLFIFAFIVNTFTEIIRVRLRRRYGQV